MTKDSCALDGEQRLLVGSHTVLVPACKRCMVNAATFSSQAVMSASCDIAPRYATKPKAIIGDMFNLGI